MKKIVIWSGKSQTELASIDRETAMRILHAIDGYLTDGSGDVKKLRPPRRELRLRIGDYRVFFLSLGPGAVEILSVKHRSQAYFRRQSVTCRISTRSRRDLCWQWHHARNNASYPRRYR